MENIVKFCSYYHFYKFFFGDRLYIPIRAGVEGFCYLSPREQLVYKKLHLQRILRYPYKTNKIIMQQDLDLESFVFPITLFVSHNTLLGYTSHYVGEDLFSISNRESFSDLLALDFDVLRSAYEIIRKDTIKLSQEHILIDDLLNNLVFNGDRFYAIDTCGYQRVEKDVLKENLFYLDETIKGLLEMWTRTGSNILVGRNLNVDNYLLTLEKKLKERGLK